MAIAESASGPDERFDVLCIDDNEQLIDALECRLECEAGFVAMHRAEPLSDAAATAQRVRADIVLLDVDLPDGIDSLVLLKQIVKNVPDSRVIMFTGYPSGKLVADTIGLGAWGFVSKGVAADRLIAAIHSVRHGDVAIELD